MENAGHPLHSFASAPDRVITPFRNGIDPTIIEIMNAGASILLAEDREEDIILIQKSFKKSAIGNPLFIVRDGEEAINYLSGTGRFADRAQFPLPAMFLLDLKMPGTDGFDVLRWISTQPDLKSLLVIVLTCSESIRDVETAYKLGASSFLVKPMDFSDTVEVVKETVHYWLGRNMTSGPSRLNAPKSNWGKEPGASELNN